MLVLSRKLDESIVIPGLGLTITVLRIGGNQVRLGINGPLDVEIHREEVWRRICEAQAPPNDLECVAAR